MSERRLTVSTPWADASRWSEAKALSRSSKSSSTLPETKSINSKNSSGTSVVIDVFRLDRFALNECQNLTCTGVNCIVPRILHRLGDFDPAGAWYDNRCNKSAESASGSLSTPEGVGEVVVHGDPLSPLATMRCIS